MKPKVYKAEFKVLEASDDFPGGAVEGYASVFGNVDEGNDIVEKGAFKKTLKEMLPKGRVKLVDSHKVYHGTSAIIGVVPTAKEDDHGLHFTGKFSSVPSAQEVRIKIKEGILDALSFGYEVVKWEANLKNPEIRHLKELKLFEISVVAWGMNPEAAITRVKSHGSMLLGDRNLAPVDYPWNPEEATERVKSYFEDNEGFGVGGHLWVSEAKSCLPVMDIVNGQPVYVFTAVQAALKSIREPGDHPWAADRTVLEESIKQLYIRFGKTMPEEEIPVDISSVSVILADMDDMTTRLKLDQMLRQLKA